MADVRIPECEMLRLRTTERHFGVYEMYEIAPNYFSPIGSIIYTRWVLSGALRSPGVLFYASAV